MRIDDGFSTRISLGSVLLWEKEVTPPGAQGGGANDTTTMRNEVWRTRAPKKLKTLSDGKATVAYDPAIYNDIVSLLQVNQEITVTFADGSTLMFWGWLDEFTPGSCAEGAHPTADVTIIPSNQNDSGEETAPVYTAA